MRRGWGRDIRGWSRTSWRWRLACCRWRGTTSCRIGRRGNSSLRGWPQLCKLRIKLVKSKYSYKSLIKLVKLILHTCRSVCGRRFRGHFCVSRLLLRPSVRFFIWKNINLQFHEKKKYRFHEFFFLNITILVSFSVFIFVSIGTILGTIG